MISIERLERIAAEHAFQPATTERVIRLTDVLQRLAKDPIVGKATALKGGTALNLFYLGLDRLSVDIDLNYVASPDRETMLKDQKALNDRIPRLMRSWGYTVTRDASSEHAGGKWRFRYNSAYGRQGTLEIDVNYLYRSPFFGVHTLDSVDLGGYVAKNVQVVDLHEICAGKLVSLSPVVLRATCSMLGVCFTPTASTGILSRTPCARSEPRRGTLIGGTSAWTATTTT